MFVQIFLHFITIGIAPQNQAVGVPIINPKANPSTAMPAHA